MSKPTSHRTFHLNDDVRELAHASLAILVQAAWTDNVDVARQTVNAAERDGLYWNSDSKPATEQFAGRILETVLTHTDAGYDKQTIQKLIADHLNQLLTV